MAFRVAKRTIGDSEVAKDLVQEVFIYLFEKIQQNKKVHHFSSWVYQATYHKCIDYIRSQSKYEDLDKAQHLTNEESKANSTDTKKWIDSALNQLKPEERFLVILYSEGLSYKEMSEITGIKFTSIGKTLSRVLKKLEKTLKPKHYELFG